MSALLAEFKAGTKKDLTQQVEKVIDMPQVPIRIYKGNACVPRVESGAEAPTAANKRLSDDFASIAQQRDELATIGPEAKPDTHASATSSATASLHIPSFLSAGSRRWSSSDASDATPLFFWRREGPHQDAPSKFWTSAPCHPYAVCDGAVMMDRRRSAIHLAAPR